MNSKIEAFSNNLYFFLKERENDVALYFSVSNTLNEARKNDEIMLFEKKNLEKVKKEIGKIQKDKNNVNYISNVGGFQSQSLNSLDNNIKENLFIKPATEYIKQFNKDHKVELSNFWINSNNKNDYSQINLKKN